MKGAREMPEISVIVPVYKAEAYITRCVDSILSQTFTDFELILVDDGSPDRSGIICDEYAQQDSRVRVIHKPNGGVSSARNTGLDSAYGRWITFVDSDDYVTECYLEHLFHPNYDMCVSGHIHYVENTKQVLTKGLSTQTVSKLDSETFSELIEQNGKYWLLFCWGRLYRRDILEQNSIRFDQSIKIGEDYIFFIQYLTYCQNILLSSDTGYIHTDRTGTLSKTFDIPFFEHMVKAETIVRRFLQDFFQAGHLCKSDEDIAQIYADAIFSVSADVSFSFLTKYRIFRYIYASPYFKLVLEQPQRYYYRTSRTFRFVIDLQSPFLTLVALRVVQKLRK